MDDLVYKRVTSVSDPDIPYMLKMYNHPDISCFISVSDNYFNYVTHTEKVYFYKVYQYDKLIGAIHLEMFAETLYMDILIFPKFQRNGLGTKIVKDLQADALKLNYHKIQVSIDEKNKASIKTFERSGFIFIHREGELLNYIYKMQ